MWPLRWPFATFEDEDFEEHPTDIDDLVNNIEDDQAEYFWTVNSLSRLREYAAQEREFNWSDQVVGNVPFIDTIGIADVENIIRTCKNVRVEAKPILAAKTHLMVFDRTLTIHQLPQAFVRLFLDRLQKVTFSVDEDRTLRHHYEFDLRKMSKLKELHLLEPERMVLKKSIAHLDVDQLIAYLSGAIGETFLAEWFQREQDIMEAETRINQSMPSSVQELHRERNEARYWLRDLLHDKSRRTFSVIKRIHLQIRMQLLKPSAIQEQIVDRKAFVDLVCDTD